MNPWIEITQWREYGDDDDSIDIRVLDDTEVCVPCDLAEQYELEYDPDDEDQGDNIKDLLVINQSTIKNGEVFETASGKKYRVTIEEVIE